jgi:hypothetical protein
MIYTQTEGNSVLEMQYCEKEEDLLIIITDNHEISEGVDFLLNKEQLKKLIQYFKYLEIELEN